MKRKLIIEKEDEEADEERKEGARADNGSIRRNKIPICLSPIFLLSVFHLLFPREACLDNQTKDIHSPARMLLRDPNG